MARNSYGVLITAIDTVKRPDGKQCLQVTWVESKDRFDAPTGSARTVPGSTANSEALERFHAYPDQPVDIIRNGRGQIISVQKPFRG